jgi:hypothetical protein
MTTKNIYPTITFFAPCKKKGHDNQPLNMLMTLPSSTERLLCANCLIFDYPDLNKNAIPIKEFLDNYKRNEDEINRFVDENLEFVKYFEQSVDVTATFTEEENLTALEFVKRSELNAIEQSFGDLLRAMKILIDDASQKLKVFVKKYFDDIERSISELNEYDLRRKSGKLKEYLTGVKAGDNKSMTRLFDYMCKHPIRTDLTILDVKNKLQNYPRLNQLKFETAKEDILEYTTEKLKDMLEWHVKYQFFILTLGRQKY